MTAPVITAWSAISPCGLGREAFERGWAAGPVPAGPAGERWPAPPEDRAYLAGDFGIEDALGAKGTGSMDRCSAMAIDSMRRLLGAPGAPVPDPVTGVVLGTTSGSAQTQLEFTRDSLTRRKPHLVNPATMPFALMNSAAAQCAIWCALTGPNVTLAAGRMSGLATLRYGARLLRTGRASGVVCGAVEEYSGMRAWQERHRHGGTGDRVALGEGAAVLFLEPPGSPRPVLAEVLGIGTRVAVDGDLGAALAACVRDRLAATDLDPAAVDLVACSATGGDLARAEEVALTSVFGAGLGAGVPVLNPATVAGDLGAAVGPFQVAALFSARAVGLALVTAVDEDETVGCALLRLPERSAANR